MASSFTGNAHPKWVKSCTQKHRTVIVIIWYYLSFDHSWIIAESWKLLHGWVFIQWPVYSFDAGRFEDLASRSQVHSQSIASPKRQFFMLMIPDGCWCLLWKTALPRSEWLQHPNSWPGNQRGTLVVVKVSNVFECMGSAFTFWRLEVQLAKLCKSFSLRNQQKVTSSSDTKVIQ